MKNLAAALTLTLAAQSLLAENACNEDAMLVFDGSGSMAQMGFNGIAEPRILEARRAVREVLPSLASDRHLGLLIYGPGGRGSCSGFDMRFSPIPNAAQQIIQSVDSLRPSGDTALVKAVALAADVLQARGRGGTVVLVTDGEETCGGSPCRLGAQLAALEHPITVHVIGFKVRGDSARWADDGELEDRGNVTQCLADRTGGYYVNAETVEDLIAALRKTLGCHYLS